MSCKCNAIVFKALQSHNDALSRKRHLTCATQVTWNNMEQPGSAVVLYFVTRLTAKYRSQDAMTACWNLVQLTKCSTVEHAAGRLVHHMTQEQMPGQPAHSKVHNSPVPGSHCCSLDVVDVQPVSSPPEVAARWGATAYESLLELQTGRTHQVGFGQTRPAPPGDTETYPCSSQLITNLLSSTGVLSGCTCPG